MAIIKGDDALFTKEKDLGGVVQRDFAIDVKGESVPCVIWSPVDAKGPRNLLLMGHGGSQHKKTASLRARAVNFAQEFGWATLAIDAPGHGDRISREEAAQLAQQIGARVAGQIDAPLDPEFMARAAKRTEMAVPEWQAALDTALDFEFVAGTEQIGYWGVSMGTAIGVPFVASEPRIKCAVFGLLGLTGLANQSLESFANRIKIPVQFVFQWEDAVAPRQIGIEFFNAFGSEEKTMHINPGGHMDIPEFEADAWKAFYLRHLGR